MHPSFPVPPPSPFHLLEVTVISAQDLFPAVRSSMRTYAIAWINPTHKLRTRLDPSGHTDPSWNDKFVFRIDDSTLRSATSSITVEIYAVRSKLRPGSDTLIGTARAVLSTLRPSSATRFVAIQIRRPASLRPQGIMNVGVALIDAIVRSLPMYGGELKEEMVRSRSMRVVESKLEKWRAELPALVQGEEEDREKEEDRKKGGGRGRGKSQRTAGRMSCLCLAGETKDGVVGGNGRVS